jgi:hypothetical protein
VAIGRGGQVQQGLQQALDVGGLEQVLAADHVGDPLQGVVQHHGQVIGHPDVLAGQDDVAGGLGTGGDQAGLAVGPRAFLDEAQVIEAAQRAAGRVQRQPPGEGLAALQPRGLLVGMQRTADERLGRLVRRAADVQLLAGAKAAIDQALVAQHVDGPVIVGQVLGLAAHRLFPFQAQPGQVLQDRGLEFGTAAGGVDVLDPQHEPAVRRPGRRRRRSGPRRRGRDAGGRSGRARSGWRSSSGPRPDRAWRTCPGVRTRRAGRPPRRPGLPSAGRTA